VQWAKEEEQKDKTLIDKTLHKKTSEKLHQK